MKKIFSVLVLCVVAILHSTSCGNSDKGTAGSTDVVSAEQLYADNCMICHGKDGTAGMSGATDLSTSVLSHTNTVDVITNGRNTMRAFSGQFSKEEIEALAKHVESLRK